jgi:hypothetical protein
MSRGQLPNITFDRTAWPVNVSVVRTTPVKICLVFV